MNIPEFIGKKIESAFEELTEKLADELATEYGEDMPTGALAFEMMSAEMFLQEKWREYCKQKAAQQGLHTDAAIVPPVKADSQSDIIPAGEVDHLPRR